MESSNLIDLLYASALEWNQDHPLMNGVDQFTPSSREEDPIDLGFAKIKEELASVSMHEEQTVLHEISSYLPPPPPSPVLNGDLGLDPLSFGMILPTENITSLHLPSMMPEPPQPSLSIQWGLGFGRNIVPDFAIAHHLQASAHGSSMSLHKMLPSINGVTESKRANCNRSYQLKVSQGGQKKPRFESRPSFSPFKVRKEKLGDRIAALQQLVAPFGKTDTASVLMEAIGYIKFLQDQVEVTNKLETLSVPYKTSFNNNILGTREVVSADENDSEKPDLRSRGLCLVPLSCTSYVTNIETGDWPPPNFMGGT